MQGFRDGIAGNDGSLRPVAKGVPVHGLRTPRGPIDGRWINVARDHCLAGPLEHTAYKTA